MLTFALLSCSPTFKCKVGLCCLNLKYDLCSQKDIAVFYRWTDVWQSEEQKGCE